MWSVLATKTLGLSELRCLRRLSAVGTHETYRVGLRNGGFLAHRSLFRESRIRQKSVPEEEPATPVMKNIRRATRRCFSAGLIEVCTCW